jgi:hypothetical protein
MCQFRGISMKVILSFLIITLFAACNYAQSTYEFLRLNLDARTAALGGSFVSGNDDANVIFHNPAGISLLQNNPVSFSFLNHILDINSASLAYSSELENFGRFAAAIKYINYGEFEGKDEFGAETGNFSANEAAFIIGYSNSLDVNFYYGANVKLIYSGISDRSSTAIAIDAGLHYEIPSQMLNIGLAFSNIGTQISSYYDTREQLPFDVTIGISKRLEHLPLKLYLDFHKLNEDRNDFFQRFHAFSLGAEFTLSKALRLRAGYENEKRKELKIGSFAGLAGFNAGIGIVISDYRFDYGFSSMGAIGNLHRISLSTAF